MPRWKFLNVLYDFFQTRVVFSNHIFHIFSSDPPPTIIISFFIFLTLSSAFHVSFFTCTLNNIRYSTQCEQTAYCNRRYFRWYLIRTLVFLPIHLLCRFFYEVHPGLLSSHYVDTSVKVTFRSPIVSSIRTRPCCAIAPIQTTPPFRITFTLRRHLGTISSMGR